MKKQFLLPTMLLLCLAVAQAQPAARHKVIEISAHRFAFTPAVITLKKGETVTLRLKSEDVTHGFFLRTLNIDTDIPPGKATEIEVTPQKTGTFTLICDHFCGEGHGNMAMKVVVTD